VPTSECRYQGLCPAGPLSAIGSRDTIDLLADRSRKLPHIDPTGREMLISRGTALLGLRLAIREMGYLPDVQLLPDLAQTTCSPRCGAAAPMTPAEQQMLTAMPYRHTRRGPFTGDLLPRGPAGRTAARRDSRRLHPRTRRSARPLPATFSTGDRGRPSAARQPYGPGAATALGQAAGQPGP
jgi:hypothetical protein